MNITRYQLRRDIQEQPCQMQNHRISQLSSHILAGTNNHYRHSFVGRHLIFGLQCLSIMNSLNEILWLTVIPEVADQPCLHRGLETQRSIREYFSLLARKMYVIPGTVFLANPRWTLQWTTDLKKHQQVSLPRKPPWNNPCIWAYCDGQAGDVNPMGRDPVDDGSSDGSEAVLLLLPATNCPEFIAALTLQGRTCLPKKPEGREIMIPSDFCVWLAVTLLCLLKVIAFPGVKPLPREQKLWNPGKQTPSPHHHTAELAILTSRELPRLWCKSLSRTQVGCAVSHLISQSSPQDKGGSLHPVYSSIHGGTQHPEFRNSICCGGSTINSSHLAPSAALWAVSCAVWFTVLKQIAFKRDILLVSRINWCSNAWIMAVF